LENKKERIFFLVNLVFSIQYYYASPFFIQVFFFSFSSLFFLFRIVMVFSIFFYIKYCNSFLAIEDFDILNVSFMIMMFSVFKDFNL